MKTNLKKEYEKQQKKQKAKTILKWIAVGLGWSALLGAFVGMVALGCKSCANKKVDSTNATRIIGDYTLNRPSITGNYDGELLCKPTYLPMDQYEYQDFDLSLDSESNEIGWQNDFLTIDGNSRSVNTSIISTANGYTLNYYVGPGRAVGSFIPTLFASFTLKYQQGNCATYVSGVGDCIITTQHALFDSFADAYEVFDYDENYFWWGLLLGYNSNPISENEVNFTFADQINRYGPLNGNNAEVILSNTSYVGKHICFSGYFSDMAGNKYKNVLIEYKTGNNIGYIDNNGDTQIFDGIGLYYYGLYYRDLNNNDILVNKWVYSNQKDGHYYTNQSEWLDYTYQNITIYSFDNITLTLPINPLQDIARLEVFNKNNGGSGGIPSDNGLVNAFNLLRLAFQSIANILNISILPGLTLGTFIFIPVVVMVVIFIVWLFKR